jgi:RNA 2',3'-cyclic 3'-phosphodiesterase
MRLFIGIPLAAAVSEELAALAARLGSGGDGLRWTARESWHITLQFLGNASREQCQCVAGRLRELHLPPVPVRLGKLGCFERAGVFLATVEPSPALLGLQERVVATTGPCGFAAEARPYQPHITLARSGRGQRQNILALKAKIGRPPEFTGFAAGEFLLYESFLSPTGSRYEVRARFSLDS